MLNYKDKLKIYKKIQLLEKEYKEDILNFCESFCSFEEILKNFNKLNDKTLVEIKLFIDNIVNLEQEKTIPNNNIFLNSSKKKNSENIINLLCSIYKLCIINTSYLDQKSLEESIDIKKTKKRKRQKKEKTNETKNIKNYFDDIEIFDNDSILDYLIEYYKYNDNTNFNINSGFYKDFDSEKEEEIEEIEDSETDSLLYNYKSDCSSYEENIKETDIDSNSIYSTDSFKDAF